MATTNYLRYLDGGGQPSTIKYRPLFQLGERKREFAGENPDILIDGKWWNSTNGDEKIVNGNFESGTVGWTAINATLNNNNGVLNIVDGGAFSKAWQLENTIIGKEYILKFDIVDGGTTGPTVSYGDNIPSSSSWNDNIIVDTTFADGSYSFELIATSTTTYLEFGSNSTDTAKYDNVSFFETEIEADTEYIEQFTYGSKDGKLTGIVIEGNQPVDIVYEHDAPSIVEDTIQCKRVVQTENRKIINLGTIFINNRYVEDNPFGNENYEDCDVKVELFVNGFWSEVNIGSLSGSSTSDVGAKAYSNKEGIVIQTSGDFLVSSSPSSGGTHGFGSTSAITSAPARVIVTYQGVAK